jgi:hypothetical protein
MKQHLLLNMARIKDVITLAANLVNVTFAFYGHTYIYELGLVCESIIITNLSRAYL